MASQVMFDDVLGELRRNDEYGWWEAELRLAPNTQVTVVVHFDASELGAVPDSIRDSASRLKSGELSIRAAAANELLPLYNDTWSEGERIDEQEFMKRIQLEGATFYAPEGDAELFYKDGDLFAGHSIVVSINRDGTFEDANLAG